MYKAGGVSEDVFLLQQSKAGLEGVVVEDLEVWEVLAMVCLYEGGQKQPMEIRWEQINPNHFYIRKAHQSAEMDNALPWK